MDKAVFLDRDGVINPLIWNPLHKSYDSPHSPKEVSLLPGVAESLVALDKAGYFLIVVSNQPSAAKGKCSLADLKATHEYLEKIIFKETGLKLKDYFYCHHHPESVIPELKKNCGCRKPGNLSIETAVKKYDVDKTASWKVGDRDLDIDSGRAAGLKTILIDYELSPEFRIKKDADYFAKDLAEAVRIILK